jgi:hypothetical protein
MTTSHSAQIGDILRDMQVLTTVDITRILLEQQRTGQRFGRIVLGWRLGTEEQVNEAWARQLVTERRRIDLDDFGVDPQALKTMTPEQARHFRVVPVRCWGSHLVVAMVSMPLDCQILSDIADACGMDHVYPCYCSRQQLQRYLDRYHPLSAESAA